MDPFRRNFLDHVELVISKTPRGDTLSELLKIASPNLNESDIDDEVVRSKSFKILKARIHPDKHPNDDRATKLFQDLENFYAACVTAHDRGFKSPSRNKNSRTSSSPNSTSYPLEFDAEEKWPQIHLGIKYDLPPDCSERDISSIVAYQCINARGAITHGRLTELVVTPPSTNPLSASEVFQNYGGSKVLSTVSDIKEELMNNGPVVSTSFVQSEALVQTVRHSFLLVPMSINRQEHPVLIVGWKHTSVGEVWIVKPFRYDSFKSDLNISIAFGQHGIDTECIAPVNNFEHCCWQQGPYWDVAMGHALDWRSWNGLCFDAIESDFDKVEILKEGVHEAIENRTLFVIRDMTKIAHSRKAYLTEIHRRDGKWKVTYAFTI